MTRLVIRVVTFFLRVLMARGAVFGLTSSRRGRGGGFRGNWRRNTRGGGRSGNNSSENAPLVVRGDDGSQTQERFENARINDEVDEKLGFVRLNEGPKQEGWLVNMHPVRVFSTRCALGLINYLESNQRPRLAWWPIRGRLLLYQRRWWNV